MRLAIMMLLLGFFSVPGTTAHAEEKTWQWNGDLRLRLERIDYAEKSALRERMRARLGLGASLAEDLKLGFRLATGGTDPTVTNETIGDGWVHKTMRLDLAYLQYQPYSGVEVLAGKMKNPFMSPGRSDLILDTDLTPEGIYAGYTTTIGAFTISPRAANFVVEEHNTDPDIELNVGQLGVGYRLAGAMLIVGGGIYHYANIKGSQVFSTGTQGNSISVNNNSAVYENDYKVQELFFELTYHGLGAPQTFYGDFIKNAAVSKENQGQVLGIRLGDAMRAKLTEVGIEHRILQRDATLGAFADSEFAGGGAGISGLKYYVGYGLTDNTNIYLTHIEGEHDNTSSLISTKSSYDLTQLDLSMRF